MALTNIPAFPPRSDPGFSTYVNNFFTSVLPNFVQELDDTVIGFNNGSFTTTSATSQTINTTTPKTFTVGSGLSFVKGMWITITENTGGTTSNNYMIGRVQSYSGTSLVVDITHSGGTGTLASWRIAISPPVLSSAVAEARMETGAGYGTTNTFVRNFTSVTINTGTSITPAVSATLGASMTINATGVYAVTYQEASATGALYVSRNSAVLTAAPVVGERLTGGAASGITTINFTGTIASGSVLRAHPSATGITATTGSYFHVVRLA